MNPKDLGIAYAALRDGSVVPMTKNDAGEFRFTNLGSEPMTMDGILRQDGAGRWGVVNFKDRIVPPGVAMEFTNPWTPFVFISEKQGVTS